MSSYDDLMKNLQNSIAQKGAAGLEASMKEQIAQKMNNTVYSYQPPKYDNFGLAANTNFGGEPLQAHFFTDPKFK